MISVWRKRKPKKNIKPVYAAYAILMNEEKEIALVQAPNVLTFYLVGNRRS